MLQLSTVSSAEQRVAGLEGDRHDCCQAQDVTALCASQKCDWELVLRLTLLVLKLAHLWWAENFLGHGRGMLSEAILLEDLGFSQESSYKRSRPDTPPSHVRFLAKMWLHAWTGRHSCQGASTSPEPSRCGCHTRAHSKPGWASFPLQVARQIFCSVDQDDVVSCSWFYSNSFI